MITGKKPASLYFHIPFCTRKCPYCHFFVLPNNANDQASLYDALALEWDCQKEKLEDKEIVSIYFGGGTPSLFIDYIPGILKWTQKLSIAPNCEITIETNPEDVTEELLDKILEAGINRISLGVQSFDDSSLQILNRTHNAKKALDSISLFHQKGVKNFSIDLMFDLPHQTLDSFLYTLSQLKRLDVPHISLYNLTIEKHTAFDRKKKQLEPFLPNQALSMQLLQAALEEFSEMGLQRYEISAFAKPGFASQHNLGYWSSRPYLGLGPSACSFWEHKRWKNIAHLRKYRKALMESTSPAEYVEELPLDAQFAEHLILHLRREVGADLRELEELFGNIPLDLRSDIDNLIHQGHLIEKEQHLKLSEKGLLFYDSIAEDLIRLPQP